MSILPALLLALVAGLPATPPGPQDPTSQEPPSAERVAAAVEALTTAFGPKASKSAEPRLTALLEHGRIDDERVIAKVVIALHDKHLSVRIEAVEALGSMTSERSLSALLKFFERRHYKLRLDVELWPRLFRAVGRRGDPAAISVLLQDVRGQLEPTTLRARVFALANIRTPESVESVLAILEELDPERRTALLADARIALLVLTGETLEGDAESQRDWWNARRESFVLPAAAPRLEGPSWQAWRAFWELPPRADPERHGGGEH